MDEYGWWVYDIDRALTLDEMTAVYVFFPYVVWRLTYEQAKAW